MNAISKTLGISRSNLSERLNSLNKVRAKRYFKAEDTDILSSIRTLCALRSSYGYRRVTAILNRQRELNGLELVNHKRIYRIMRHHDLLLEKYTGKSSRTHDGKVVTLASNMRWSSDTFTIKCFNGEKVEVSFCIDTCDREIISFVATSTATNGEMIRDLIALSFEARFRNCEYLPSNIEWLSDNGPPYIAHATRKFGESLGFIMCNTPSYSPESNGVSEAFVKTFKRDYVYLNELSSARYVISQLELWFEDYNENAPHKGLRMKSPREFRRAYLTN